MLNKLKQLIRRTLESRLTDSHELRQLIADNRMMQQQLADCRAFIAEQQTKMDSVLMELRTNVDGPFAGERAIAAIDEEKQHEFDAFYIAFEDRFRGSYEAINKRLTVYQPLIDKLKGLPGNLPFLDIGCGRGEWLDLLKANGCRGKGVDTNRVALARCREQGFDVLESDASEYLRGQADASHAAVTGFHLIEHLPFAVLMSVIHDAFRILHPGGAIIFETPDPENVIVSSCNFYLDPTHRNPVPDVTLAFILEYCGFIDVDILKLHKISDPIQTDNTLVNEMQRRFFMSQDYAVIGTKPL